MLHMLPAQHHNNSRPAPTMLLGSNSRFQAVQHLLQLQQELCSTAMRPLLALQQQQEPQEAGLGPPAMALLCSSPRRKKRGGSCPSRSAQHSKALPVAPQDCSRAGTHWHLLLLLLGQQRLALKNCSRSSSHSSSQQLAVRLLVLPLLLPPPPTSSASHQCSCLQC
jgi:hypothetical protein